MITKFISSLTERPSFLLKNNKTAEYREQVNKKVVSIDSLHKTNDILIYFFSKTVMQQKKSLNLQYKKIKCNRSCGFF